MADLAGGQTLTCGTLKFSKFEYSSDAVTGFPAAAAVMVDCVTRDAMTGIRVTGPWTYTALDGRLPAGRFAYLLTVLDGGGIVTSRLASDMQIGAGDGSVQTQETKFPAFNNCYT